MSKISNVITMLEILSDGKKYSIDELSKILEVSPRMVRSYKNELDKTGIIIDTIMGPYGGYVLNQNIKIPKRKFKTNEYKILDKYIKEEKDEKVKNNLILLQDKIKGIFKGSRNELKCLNNNDIENKKYNCLARAIKEKRKVLITYYSYNIGEIERIIHPAEMFLFEDGWFCAAYCELRKDFRHFELKRIRNFKLLDENF